jgi:hypothetical protein
MLKKIALLPMLMIVACLTAGVYGMLHNQISYSVSPEYFHAFKFQQFGIPQASQGRVGASIVGWNASWWMGILIGIPVFSIGLILPGWKLYLRGCLIAIAVVVATAVLVGMGGLVFACLTISESTRPSYWLPIQVTDKVSFARAGMMHNFSYLGGFLGIITGSIYLIVIRLQRRKIAKLSQIHTNVLPDTKL